MKPPTVAFGLRPGTYDITIYSPTKLCYLLDFLVVVIYAPSNFVNGCVSIAAKLFVRLVDRFMILHISDPNTDLVEICTARITGINGCTLQRSFHQGQAGQRLHYYATRPLTAFTCKSTTGALVNTAPQ